MMYGGHLTIIPGDRDRVPTPYGDGPAVGGITLPAYSIARLKLLGLGSGHVAPPLVGVGIDNWQNE